MRQTIVCMGLMICCFLLLGINSAMGAFWDEPCRVAIEKLQDLQEKVALKKKEIDTARMVEVIPSNFISGEMRTSLRPKDGTTQALSELKILFRNGEFAINEFSQTCLSRNLVPQ